MATKVTSTVKLSPIARKIRKKQGLTLKTVANKIDRAGSFLSLAERGEILISSKVLRELAEVLGVRKERLRAQKKVGGGGR